MKTIMFAGLNISFTVEKGGILWRHNIYENIRTQFESRYLGYLRAKLQVEVKILISRGNMKIEIIGDRTNTII